MNFPGPSSTAQRRFLLGLGLALAVVLSPCKLRNFIEAQLDLPQTEVLNKSKAPQRGEICASSIADAGLHSTPHEIFSWPDSDESKTKPQWPGQPYLLSEQVPAGFFARQEHGQKQPVYLLFCRLKIPEALFSFSL